nr:immunoglobulin heavy chain junction region [Macaca mulatta]MOV56049.1 immunoglobulin heavy chain junction region [Macaca mulatta]MOV57670.1 immunoglobulin heavy chain junction region [Macaca mulatta]MOV60327.1 immunoglobulin heavy chain junction region [Macaca mulatta]
CAKVINTFWSGYYNSLDVW